MGGTINLVNNFKAEKVIFKCGPYNNLENSKIYRTDKDGSIMFKIKNKKLKLALVIVFL